MQFKVKLKTSRKSKQEIQICCEHKYPYQPPQAHQLTKPKPIGDALDIIQIRFDTMLIDSS